MAFLEAKYMVEMVDIVTAAGIAAVETMVVEGSTAVVAASVAVAIVAVDIADMGLVVVALFSPYQRSIVHS
jgi:hypothetical protein